MVLMGRMDRLDRMGEMDGKVRMFHGKKCKRGRICKGIWMGRFWGWICRGLMGICSIWM